jgi:hypothetical protein
MTGPDTMKSIGRVAGPIVIESIKKVGEIFDWLTGGSKEANATLDFLKKGVIGLGVVIGIVAATFAAVGAAAVVALSSIGFVISDVVKYYDRLKASTDGLWTNIKASLSAGVDYVNSLPAKMAQAGKDLVQGLADGIKSMANAPVEAIKSIASSVGDAFRAALKIHSPSVVMMEAGEMTAEGAAQGIKRGSPKVEQASAAMATSVISSASDPGPMARSVSPTGDGGSPGGPGGNQYVAQVEINVYGSGGQGDLSQGELTTKIRDEVERGVRSAFSRVQAQG